jgi:hypothetical protein
MGKGNAVPDSSRYDADFILADEETPELGVDVEGTGLGDDEVVAV